MDKSCEDFSWEIAVSENRQEEGQEEHDKRNIQEYAEYHYQCSLSCCQYPMAI